MLVPKRLPKGPQGSRKGFLFFYFAMFVDFVICSVIRADILQGPQRLPRAPWESPFLIFMNMSKINIV